MDPIKLGSGDNENAQATLQQVDLLKTDDEDEKAAPKCENPQSVDANQNIEQNVITAQTIDDNEAKLKDRIAQCRDIIESLKIELNEEKSKLEKQSKSTQQHSVETIAKCTTSQYVTTNNFMEDITSSSGMYSDCVESKLSCDESLIEYEKQLQRYQNTLNMAQTEKKNAIRKQMLTKAYRLKLLEVENQCNIELLRVKQSLQCLEPLQMIASKWKMNTDDTHDGNSYELNSRYPELHAISNCDMNSARDALVPKQCLDGADILKDDYVCPDQSYKE